MYSCERLTGEIAAAPYLMMGPFDSMNADRAIETFYGTVAQILEPPILSKTQLGNDIRDQNLLWLRVRTQPCRQLHRRPEQIVLALYGLSCCSADSYRQRILGVLPMTLGQGALNADGAANRRRGRHERRHDAVSGMFDLATLSSRQSVSDNRVMDLKQGHTCLVSPGLIRRADNIGEKNSPDCRIAAAGRPTAQHHRSGFARFTFAEKGLYKLGVDLDESFRDLAVGVTMH
jgi:hypothetical protein